VSSLWETRYRLVLQQLGELAERLSGAKPMAPAALEEWIVKLLATMLMLLRQHHINKRGQCRFCGWTSWKWRFWRRRCTVYVALDYAMRQSLDVVWWKVFVELGREVSLEDVRRWNGERREKDARPAGVSSTQSTSRPSRS
jgi:hypothetical protein